MLVRDFMREVAARIDNVEPELLFQIPKRLRGLEDFRPTDVTEREYRQSVSRIADEAGDDPRTLDAFEAIAVMVHDYIEKPGNWRYVALHSRAWGYVSMPEGFTRATIWQIHLALALDVLRELDLAQDDDVRAEVLKVMFALTLPTTYERTSVPLPCGNIFETVLPGVNQRAAVVVACACSKDHRVSIFTAAEGAASITVS